MKTRHLFILIICLALIAGNCKKDDNSGKSEINISGFKLTDNLGNQFGVYGNADDDWQIINWSQLSTTEQSYLNFTDTITLTNTVTATLNQPVGFPNPCSFSTTLGFNASDSVKLKVALVDSRGTVYRKFSIKMKGWMYLSFDLSNRSEFPSKKSLRCYYSFSSTTQQNFKAGYGDIKVCDDGPPFRSCF